MRDYRSRLQIMVNGGVLRELLRLLELHVWIRSLQGARVLSWGRDAERCQRKHIIMLHFVLLGIGRMGLCRQFFKEEHLVQRRDGA